MDAPVEEPKRSWYWLAPAPGVQVKFAELPVRKAPGEGAIIVAGAAAPRLSITVVRRLFDPFAAMILIGKFPLAELVVEMINDAMPVPVTIADEGETVVFDGNPEGVTVT